MKWHRVKFSTGGLYADDSFDLWTEIHCFFEKKKKNSDGSRSDKLGSSEQVPIQQVWLKW